jgi:hypothetical protein
MLQRLTTLVVIAVVALVGAAIAVAANGTTSSESSKTRTGAACVQAGIGFLLENDLLRAAATKQIDYDTIDSDDPPYTSGLINADLPAPAFLTLGTVVKLHRTNPELFDWCSGA